MTTPDVAAHFDLYLVRGFFDARACAEIIAEMRCAPDEPATIYGRSEAGSVDERARKVTRLMPSLETVELVRRRLLECRGEVGEHFGMSLTDCEEPQFLRYRVGDFFVAHQDGNTGMLRLEREQARKVSVVIFLNHQSDAPLPDAYGGGSLVFSDWRVNQSGEQFPLAGEAGTLVAFRAETTHEVIPVTRGERYSIVSWYR